MTQYPYFWVSRKQGAVHTLRPRDLRPRRPQYLELPNLLRPARPVTTPASCWRPTGSRFSRNTPNGRRPAPRPPRRPAPSCARSTPPSDTTNHGAAAHRHCNTRRLCLCAAGQLTVFARCRGETAEADKSRGSSGLSLPDTHGLKRTFAPLQACCNTAYQTLHSPQVQDRCHSKE